MMKAILIAFSTYSKIPMPHFKWDPKALQYSMCAFPLVGAVIGAGEFALIDLYKGFIWSWVYSDFCCRLFCQCIGVFDFFGFFIFNWGEAASASAHVFVLRFLCLFIIYSYVVYSHFF